MFLCLESTFLSSYLLQILFIRTFLVVSKGRRVSVKSHFAILQNPRLVKGSTRINSIRNSYHPTLLGAYQTLSSWHKVNDIEKPTRLVLEACHNLERKIKVI
jgi:hypothetical protein